MVEVESTDQEAHAAVVLVGHPLDRLLDAALRRSDAAGRAKEGPFEAGQPRLLVQQPEAGERPSAEHGDALLHHLPELLELEQPLAPQIPHGDVQEVARGIDRRGRAAGDGHKLPARIAREPARGEQVADGGLGQLQVAGCSQPLGGSERA